MTLKIFLIFRNQFLISEIVPSDAQAEAKNLYSALSELLRHFWACFPATTKELEDKVFTIDTK